MRAAILLVNFSSNIDTSGDEEDFEFQGVDLFTVPYVPVQHLNLQAWIAFRNRVPIERRKLPERRFRRRIRRVLRVERME